MTGMVWNKFKSLGFTPAVKYQKLERKTFWSHAYSWSYYMAPKYTRSRSRKRGWSKLVSGRWNGDYCKLVEWSDRVSRDEARQRTNVEDDIMVVAYSLKWKWRPCDTNGPAQMGTNPQHQCQMLGMKTTERPKTWWADTFMRVAGGQRSRIAEFKWITHTTSVKATSLGIVHIVAKSQLQQGN
jgi:hypothetical protein